MEWLTTLRASDCGFQESSLHCSGELSPSTPLFCRPRGSNRPETASEKSAAVCITACSTLSSAARDRLEKYAVGRKGDTLRFSSQMTVS